MQLFNDTKTSKSQLGTFLCSWLKLTRLGPRAGVIWVVYQESGNTLGLRLSRDGGAKRRTKRVPDRI